MKQTDSHAEAVLAILQREARGPVTPAPLPARGAAPTRGVNDAAGSEPPKPPGRRGEAQG